MVTILIVEDTKSTQLLTAIRLKPYFKTVCASDGVEALDILCRMHIDLVISDIMMPRMDGYALLRHMRENGLETPVLLLTAKQSFEDKKNGFNAGTDDYMTKPVNYDELLLRIRALLRRARISYEHRIVAGKLFIDADENVVMYDGKNIPVTRKEFDLLYKFLSYPGRIFTKKQLLDEVWATDSICNDDTVKTHINRLRNKLSECSEIELLTIKGFGYKVEVRKGDAD